MVLDSHTLLWWLEGDPRLSEQARRLLDREDPLARFIVSAVSLWELRLKEVRGQLSPRRPVSTWPELLGRLPHLRIVEVALDQWLAIAEMQWDNRDPADRLIAATALQHGMSVLTIDAKFHQPGSPVRAVW
jgi:PIN domain nuclease of toxin-antitoxin system